MPLPPSVYLPIIHPRAPTPPPFLHSPPHTPHLGDYWRQARIGLRALLNPRRRREREEVGGYKMNQLASPLWYFPGGGGGGGGVVLFSIFMCLHLGGGEDWASAALL